MKECLIRISRYNPEIDGKPTIKGYIVPCFSNGSVLEALIYVYEEIDSTLLFNYGCRFKVCGKCAIKINGIPGLACETPLEEEMLLEPLDNFPVIRDLAVDRSILIEPLRKHSIVFPPSGGREVVIQLSESSQLMKCNECLICISNCPVFNRYKGFDGPLFGVKLAELYYNCDSKERLREIESYLDKCILCKRCDADCPWDVAFSEVSIKIKGELFKQKTLSIRDWVISHPDVTGLLASLWAPLFNALAKVKLVRKILDRLMKIDERVPFPNYYQTRIKHRGGAEEAGSR